MSVTIACECDGLPPHSHVGRWEGSATGDPRLMTWVPDPFDVRVWVDWKTVARDATTSPNAQAVTP